MINNSSDKSEENISFKFKAIRIFFRVKRKVKKTFLSHFRWKSERSMMGNSADKEANVKTFSGKEMSLHERF